MSTLRIGGIASGFDTDQIVKDLMRVERMKVDRLLQDRQEVQWEKEQFREITNDIRSFRDKYFDTLNRDTNMLNPATFSKMDVTSDNESLVTATGSADALTGNYQFEVKQSATAAKAVSDDRVISEGEEISLSDTMEEVNGKLKSDFNFDEDGNINLKINEAEITINKDDSLRNVMAKINNSDAGVRLSYSSFSERFTIVANSTGEGFITTDNGGNFFSALDMKLDEEDVYNLGESGVNAKFKIDGIEGEKESNSFTIDGINYSINKIVSHDDWANAEKANINVNTDVEGIIENINSFVDDYNSLIGDINGKLRDPYYRDFSPLTDDQKAEMSERDIELWEEKAQSGLLRRDPTLQRVLQNLRTALYETVGELHISEIGIETERYDQSITNPGELTIDKDKLRNAVSEDPEKVRELFTRRSYDGEDDSDIGIALRFKNILDSSIGTFTRPGPLLERAGSENSFINNSLSRQLSEIDDRINRMNERLTRQEEQYYRQFTAMEKALQELHSQGDWLMQQLNQGQF